LKSNEIHPLQAYTFRKGSRTYFTSSLFFPPVIRADVYALYAFVRASDDFEDSVPQDPAGFRAFRRQAERGTRMRPRA
jgi:phytoene synthase